MDSIIEILNERQRNANGLRASLIMGEEKVDTKKLLPRVGSQMTFKPRRVCIRVSNRSRETTILYDFTFIYIIYKL